MTVHPELLAALVEERFPSAPIEAERHEVRRPADVRMAPVEPADTLPEVRQRQRALVEAFPVESIHTAETARRALLAEQANRRAAALRVHLHRPAADVEGRAS